MPEPGPFRVNRSVRAAAAGIPRMGLGSRGSNRDDCGQWRKRMQYGVGEMGRIFVLRLEEGDQLPDIVEQFAGEHGIQRGLVFYVGGGADGSRLVVGPRENTEQGIVPMLHTLRGVHEVLAVGTLFPDDAGVPVLHLHAAAGREDKVAVGCARAGVKVWLVGEVVLLEIAGIEGRREKERGFSLLRFSSDE